ncbi:MAG TPA: DNA mismatch repair protein MutS [Chitinophagaceae bacterium]|nr:DNA mismatch repair protein MutS [Chitinophagaceae bacterium]
MQTDKVTLQDLSIFNADESLSVLHYLNFTTTNRGKPFLYNILSHPLSTIEEIEDTQTTIQYLNTLIPKWNIKITNGTLMVVEKFYETAFNHYPTDPSIINSFFYKLTNNADFSLTKYSVTHCIYFLKGINQVLLFLSDAKSKKLLFYKEKLSLILNKTIVQEIILIDDVKKIKNTSILKYAYFLKHEFKHNMQQLIVVFEQLDAYLSLAKACEKFQLTFPKFIESDQPFIEAEGLFHILLPKPVSYTICLNNSENFLFLTGANMAGKSTFIKSVGIAVYLAQLGLGVPAKKMTISLLDGMLSNIQISDNIINGESYFYNEVQRIKQTVEKISGNKKWLVLIDELFKGTNVQDAMKCSSIVVEGLLKSSKTLFILSTHLYEIAEDLKKHSNIQFKFLETTLEKEQLVFNYQLRNGISEDRIGYVILKKEGVIEMLNKLN